MCYSSLTRENWKISNLAVRGECFAPLGINSPRVFSGKFSRLTFKISFINCKNMSLPALPADFGILPSGESASHQISHFLNLSPAFISADQYLRRP